MPLLSAHAAPPQAVNSPAVAEQLRRDRALEPTCFGQDSLGLIAVSAAILGVGAGIAERRRRPSW